MALCVSGCSLLCFSGDNLVILSHNGIQMQVPISTAKQGDFIKTKDGFVEVVSNRKILGTVSFLQITLETGYVEVTEDHLIRVDEKWIPCSVHGVWNSENLKDLTNH
jgi:hypothetical protein